MAADRYASYSKWCNAVEAHATKTTNGMINFKNIEFNWAERNGDQIDFTADQLVVAAQKQITALFKTPLFRAPGSSHPTVSA